VSFSNCEHGNDQLSRKELILLRMSESRIGNRLDATVMSVAYPWRCDLLPIPRLRHVLGRRKNDVISEDDFEFHLQDMTQYPIL